MKKLLFCLLLCCLVGCESKEEKIVKYRIQAVENNIKITEDGLRYYYKALNIWKECWNNGDHSDTVKNKIIEIEECVFYGEKAIRCWEEAIKIWKELIDNKTELKNLKCGRGNGLKSSHL